MLRFTAARARLTANTGQDRTDQESQQRHRPRGFLVHPCLFFVMRTCYASKAGFKPGYSCCGLLSNWNCKHLPRSDLEAASGPISWWSLVSSSARIHGPTTHTWSESRQRGWASQGHWQATKLKIVLDSLKSQKELESGAASHRCRLRGESGLGPALPFWSWATLLNLPVSSLLILSMGSVEKIIRPHHGLSWSHLHQCYKRVFIFTELI